MQSFEMPATTPSDFVARVRAELAKRGYDRNLAVRLEGDRLTVAFRWMGTTSFDYQVVETTDGFRADLVSQRISPFHAAFTDRFERYFKQALTELGATIA
jgi:hypothetical protein